MNKPVCILAVTSLLTACAGQPRQGPPAPVESSRSQSAAAAVAEEKAEAAKEEPTVEVYAYRPPSSAPDAPPSQPQVVEQQSTGNPFVAPPTESAPPPLGTAASTPPPMVAYAQPPPPVPTLSPATEGLARQAEQQRQMGDYVGAAATLERALRIQPQEAYLWNRLARVRMEQGSHAQAGNLATRSNALAKDQPELKRDNWSIIAISKRMAGDAAGAADAEQKAGGG